MVLADKTACGLYYGLGGAVVLLQFEQFGVRIELGELEHVVKVGSAE